MANPNILSRRNFLAASGSALALELTNPGALFRPLPRPDDGLVVKESGFFNYRAFVSANAGSVIVTDPKGRIDKVIPPPAHIQNRLDSTLRTSYIPLMTLPGGKPDGGNVCLLDYGEGDQIELPVKTTDTISMDLGAQDDLIIDVQSIPRDALRAMRDKKTGAIFVLQDSTIIRVVYPQQPEGSGAEEEYSVTPIYHTHEGKKPDFVQTVQIEVGNKYVSKRPSYNSTVIV